MKRILAVILALMLLPFAALAEGGAATIMDYIGNRDFDALYDASINEIKAALGSGDGFSQTWEQMEMMLGAYAGYTKIEPLAIEGYDAYLVSCDFAWATATLAVTLDADGRLAGFAMTEYAMKEIDASDAGGYAEEDILLRAGAADETNGKLTLPEGEGPFPCLILMPGSGSSDMNVTLYGMSLFGELAHKLAQNGVATIRYDKYPYAHADLLTQEVLATFTVDDEYTYDALSAMELLESDARIGDIYVLGHSLGAMVAPRVMTAIGADRLAGGVMLAGSLKPLHVILMRQLTDMGESTETLSAYEELFSTMAEMDEEALKTNQVYGTSLWYWQDQAAFDSLGAIKALNLPVLIVQGGKDFQVTRSEGYDIYQKALVGYQGATFALYENMNHMLCEMEGEMTGTVADYANLTGVSDALVSDIAAWVLGN